MGQTEGYKIFAKALRDHFSSHPYENEVLLLLLIPTIIILLWLFFTMSTGRRRSLTTSKRDIKFFETAALQKGLESFDRDLLRNLAETADVHPIYRILLEHRTYEKALRKSEAATAQGLPGANDRKTIEYLRRLQKRLFIKER